MIWKKNCGENLKINYTILKKFLNLDAFSKDQTFYKDILKLPPSNVLEYQNNSISISSLPKFKDLTLSESNASQIEGLKNNIPLHKVIMKEESFIAGNYSTKYIEAVKPQDNVSSDFSYEEAVKKVAMVEANNMGL